jgi:hypothetical protein
MEAGRSVAAVDCLRASCCDRKLADATRASHVGGMPPEQDPDRRRALPTNLLLLLLLLPQSLPAGSMAPQLLPTELKLGHEEDLRTAPSTELVGEEALVPTGLSTPLARRRSICAPADARVRCMAMLECGCIASPPTKGFSLVRSPCPSPRCASCCDRKPADAT